MLDSSFLTLDNLEQLLKDVGVKIIYETGSDIICMCPFHDNRDSPAFNISKQGPGYLWKCWNGRCAKQGNLRSLLIRLGYSVSEVHRKLSGDMNEDEFVKYIKRILQDEEEEVNEWAGVPVEKFIAQDLQAGWPARSYALGRGISLEAFEYFQMGYSTKKNMLIIPMKNERNELVGVIGRSLTHKQYQYSSGSPRSEILWNLNKCKEYDEIVLTEGALDAVALWQDGIENVGAVLGSSISIRQWWLLRTYFDSIVAWFDNDSAGNSLRNTILESSEQLLAYIVEYPDRLIELEDGSHRALKDPGELWHQEKLDMYANRRTAIDLLLED